MTRKARRLQQGDTVGIISPSWCGAGLFPHRLERGVTALKNLGLKVRLGRHARRCTQWTAGSPEERASDFNEIWADPEVKAVIAAIGGDHSNQLLPLIDYDQVIQNPKILLGYSDVTVLALGLYARTGLVTFYGPAVLPELGEYPAPLPYTLTYLKRALFSDEPVGRIEPSQEWTDEFLDWEGRKDLERPRILQANPGPRWLRPGKAEGRLLGGCLSSLMHLRGTSYWPDWEDALLFWELSEEVPSPGRVDSMLMDLENSGVFEKISGMLIGRPYQYPAEQRPDLERVVLNRTEKFGFPVVMDLDFGHTDPKVTLPIGVHGRLNSADGTFAILESGVV